MKIKFCYRPAPAVFRALSVMVFLAAFYWPPKALARSCKDTPLRVALDIGHSAQNPGARSARGKSEFYFNQRFALELVTRAEGWPDLDVFLLHDSNSAISNKARAHAAKARGAEILISIHHDSANQRYMESWIFNGSKNFFSDKFSGFSIFVPDQGPRMNESIIIGRSLGRALRTAGFIPTLHHAERIPGENRRFIDRGIGLYEAPFTVLREALIPSILFEVGVIVNRDEETRLERSEYRQRIQSSILFALKEVCLIEQGQQRH